jgi:hypothetical protein
MRVGGGGLKCVYIAVILMGKPERKKVGDVDVEGMIILK